MADTLYEGEGEGGFLRFVLLRTWSRYFSMHTPQDSEGGGRKEKRVPTKKKKRNGSFSHVLSFSPPPHMRSPVSAYCSMYCTYCLPLIKIVAGGMYGRRVVCAAEEGRLAGRIKTAAAARHHISVPSSSFAGPSKVLFYEKRFFVSWGPRSVPVDHDSLVFGSLELYKYPHSSRDEDGRQTQTVRKPHFSAAFFLGFWMLFFELID